MKEQKVKILLIIGLLVILAGGTINYFNIQARQVYADTALRKLQVINATNVLLNDIKDAEIGQRGYIMSENIAYLAPYDSGVTHIPKDLKTLHQLLDNNTDSRKIISTKLEKQIALKFNELGQTIALQKAGKKEELKVLINHNVGKFTMDLIREDIKIILNIETKAWKLNREKAIALRDKTNYVSYFSFAIISLILFILYFIISKKTDENTDLVHQLKKLNSDLENIVKSRTVELEQSNDKLNESLQEIQENNEKLRALNEDKNKFLSIASHDLKNPLNAIVGLVELMKETPEDLTEDQKEYLIYIGEASAKMNVLISYLLDISRIEAGKNSLKIEKVDFHFEIENMIYSYLPAAKKKGVKLLFIGSDMKGMTINSDKYRIVQILDNLVSNALKYAFPNTTVEIQLYKREERAAFRIKNQGPGIKQEEIPLLFQKFQKLSSRPTGGEDSSGLGLSIAKQFVDELNGLIWCESEVDKETTFFVKFPL